jgi:CHAD domain-containing protein
MMTGTSASESVTKLLERLAFEVNHTLHAGDADAVHDLRVSIRRFSQSLALFKPAFGAKDVKKIRGRLKELMELTNGPRDCDVALKLLPKSGLPAAAALEPAIRAYRKEQVRLLIPALRRWGSRKTSSKWRAVLVPNGHSHETLDLNGAAPKLLKKILKRGARAESGEDLHQLRIDGKKARYTLELLQDSRHNGAIEQLTELQTTLGRVNDVRAARALVIDLGGAAEVERWLKRRQKKKTREFHAAWPEIEQSLRAAMVTPQRKPVRRAAPAAAPAAAALQA